MSTGVTPPTESDGRPEQGDLSPAGTGGDTLRIARCECGAQLVGDSEQGLFAAAQRHLAHHHPQLLGALEPELVQQMAETVGGAQSV